MVVIWLELYKEIGAVKSVVYEHVHIRVCVCVCVRVREGKQEGECMIQYFFL